MFSAFTGQGSGGCGANGRAGVPQTRGQERHLTSNALCHIRATV